MTDDDVQILISTASRLLATVVAQASEVAALKAGVTTGELSPGPEYPGTGGGERLTDDELFRIRGDVGALRRHAPHPLEGWERHTVGLLATVDALAAEVAALKAELAPDPTRCQSTSPLAPGHQCRLRRGHGGLCGSGGGRRWRR